MKRLGLTLLIVSLCVSACSKGREIAPSKLDYMRHDGKQILRVDLSSGKFSFLGAQEEASDFGGLIRNCTTQIAGCLSLSGYTFAFPKHAPPPNTWTAGGNNFAVVGRIDRGQLPVWLIQVSLKGDAYMHFSYSTQTGIESISLQQEGASADLAKTYFLVGEQGLLAGEPAR